MKKSIKLLGSAALSAALVMGTAIPAFADASSVAADNKSAVDMTNSYTADSADKSKGTGETTVNITTYTSQISVTVPLSVTFSLDTTGGAGYAPTNYKIINNTVVPVTVEKAVATEGVDGKYTFGAAAFTTSGTAKGASAGSIGELYAKFTPASGSTNAVELASGKKGADQTLNWTIGAAAAAGSTTKVATNGTTSYTLEQIKADWVGDRAFASSVVSNTGSINTATSLDDLTLQSGWTVQEQAAGGTEYAINISDTSSSVLSGAEATTNNAAKIVYTIKVA